MNKNSNYYTLMFIPEDHGKTFTFRIPKYLLYSLFIFLFIVLSGLLLLLFKSGEIAAKLQLLSLIRMENDKLSKENYELRFISQKIDKFDELSKYLMALAIPTSVNPLLLKDLSSNNKYSGYNESNLKDITPVNNKTLSFSSKEKYNSFPNIIPVDGWITKHFVYDSAGFHNSHQGLDFAAALGTSIKATSSGVVGKIENDKYFGLIITLFHENGFITKYGHCSQILVAKHERVNKGQTIALVGSTGRSTAPHLHYEVIKDGKNVDPSNFILMHKD